MTGTHTVQDIRFEKETMSLRVDGKQIKVLLNKISTRLLSANEMQRNLYKVSPSGYGIHWPLIDEDLSVEAILKIQTE